MVYKYIKRGKCTNCGRRTSHINNEQWFCLQCEKKMSLEKDLSVEEARILKIIEKSGLTHKEVQILLKSSNAPARKKTYNHNYKTKHIRIGVFSDAHIGHEKFDEDLFIKMGEIFRKEKVQGVYQVGDILEGISGRPGQVYELNKVGFNQQIKYAAELFNKHLKGLKIYGIDGNHDGWFKIKNNAGVIVGQELDNRVKHYTHLGEMEADVKLAPNVNMKLFHPNDGTAYATSYKLQKLIESFSGGEKPHILLEGHYHKALYMFSRNVHGIECGTLCGQTGFMRGKKIPAHKGFYILDIDVNKNGIQKFTPSFFPEYKE